MLLLSQPKVEIEALNREDRCDRCSAQALVRLLLLSGKLIDFCMHHYNDTPRGAVVPNNVALVMQGANVIEIAGGKVDSDLL